jgi:bifunctional non-homologous end joining protein LigD
MALPAVIEPCLPSPGEQPPTGPDWVHEIKHDGDIVFAHACKMGLEGIVSKRLGSRYRSGRTSDWLKFKNPEAPAVRREAEEDWSGRR